MEEFREMILSNPYSDGEEWSKILESENKQLTIYADEIDAMNQKFALKIKTFFFLSSACFFLTYSVISHSIKCVLFYSTASSMSVITSIIT